MNMFRAFMELDKINEDISRHELINRFKKATGKNYNLSDEKKFPNNKLFSMVMDAEAKVKAKKERDAKAQKTAHVAEQESDFNFDPIRTFDTCEFCNMQLNALGQCPACDLGEEDLDEEAMPRQLVEFVTASGQQVKLPRHTTQIAANNTQPATNNTQTNSAKTTTGKYKVGIVSDNGRLRAMADDGVHGLAFVAFPNNLRQFEGQHYEVDQLIWNGKNYRVAGKIEEI
jgi:hypothetical protein